MLPLITPAILTDSLDKFKETINKITTNFSSVQIDVMDGLFVQNKSFAEREELNNIESEAYFELHLMVKNPIAELATWKDVANVTNAVFHIESEANPEECINTIKNYGWKVGIALNPETGLDKILPYINLVDEIVFMTVHPGQQGAAFVPEVLAKIKEFKQSNPGVTIAADGAINEGTIKSVVEAGADKLYVGSAIVMTNDVEAEHEKLVQAIGEITI
ncbi:MAG: hypothetical protein A2563_03110 [Candidatus Magasanikbacteria bacterium RIFOXYD1_FULL_40_23]|uniref:Ribulose-phosphate 3-epimerase n=1 Tax=Candidatus Magasanikbacteria bacterium RIFOXYD1_FULL_40_23 TaxID=1798705 RepID=A0A1F6P8Y7_9BACT|nr:MAG: hypothetical protein A2563_03110 [Candidatus Magasanikbacteria bacterium RIFOXYD1_FULL_40_23]